MFLNDPFFNDDPWGGQKVWSAYFIGKFANKIGHHPFLSTPRDYHWKWNGTPPHFVHPKGLPLKMTLFENTLKIMGSKKIAWENESIRIKIFFFFRDDVPYISLSFSMIGTFFFNILVSFFYVIESYESLLLSKLLLGVHQFPSWKLYTVSRCFGTNLPRGNLEIK